MNNSIKLFVEEAVAKFASEISILKPFQDKNKISCSCTISHQSNAWDDLKKLNIK